MPGWSKGQPTRTDILKVQLAQECGCTCPYSGDPINMQTLLGPNSQFQIEHIFPRRYGDDSFANKTLCCNRLNAQKRDRTPFQAFGGDPKRWPGILTRVRRFGGRLKNEKLRRFLAPEVPLDFVERQLNDTARAARLAGEYLGLLFGGQIDGSRKRRVQVSPGRATAALREAWQLDAILHDKSLPDAIPTEKGGKNRFDHRHHALDAVVVALTDQRTLALLGTAAQCADDQGTRISVGIEPPWAGYYHAIRDGVAKIHVSWRKNHRIRGVLHKETIYRRAEGEGGADIAKTARIALADITTPAQAERIVDERIRKLVLEKLAQHAGEGRKSPFEIEANHPYFTTKHGRVFVHRVRVALEKRVTVRRIGKGVRQRWVDQGKDNHHVEVVATIDATGKQKKWEFYLCDRMTAARRADDERRLSRVSKICDRLAAAGRAEDGDRLARLVELRDRLAARGVCGVVNWDHGEGKEFQFSLAKDDYLEMADEAGDRRLFRVTEISKKEIMLRLHSDASPTTVKDGGETKKRKRIRPHANTLFRNDARKVNVDPLGNILPAND